MPAHTESIASAPASVRRFDPWPLGIIGAFAIFIALTAAFVAMAVSNRTDLVSRDYYEEELRYQERIDQMRRAAPWQGQIQVEWAEGELSVALPEEHAAAGATGTLKLYRPSAASADVQWPLALDAQGRQRIEAPGLANGLWKAQIQWSASGQTYYFDEALVIGAQK